MGILISPTTPLQVLIQARGKIANEENWCQGMMAADDCGRPVGSRDRNACRWCAVGAINAVAPYSAGSLNVTLHQQAMTPLRLAMLGSVTNFNDTSNHPRVLLAFDEAISIAREQEAREKARTEQLIINEQSKDEE